MIPPCKKKKSKMESEPRMCAICRIEETVDDRIINPCDCKGTIGYHIGCINTMMKTLSSHVCPTCKATVKTKKIGYSACGILGILYLSLMIISMVLAWCSKWGLELYTLTLEVDWLIYHSNDPINILHTWLSHWQTYWNIQYYLYMFTFELIMLYMATCFLFDIMRAVKFKCIKFTAVNKSD